jgi:uncharacterized protein
MRLTTAEQHAIADAARSTLWPGTRVLLFGSRVDDTARGGDIDLLLEAPGAPSASDQVARRQAFIARLYRQIGERRIDVVLAEMGCDAAGGVVRAARAHGVELVSV